VKVSLVIDEPGRKPLLVQVSLPPVPAVEPLSVEPVQAVHTGREPLARRLHEQVIVRSHQAPRVEAPAEHLRGLRKEHAERFSIEIVDVDVHSADAPRRHVEEAVVGQVGARSAGHAVIDGTADDGVTIHPAPLVTLLLQGLSLGRVG
jgi:hypothetical protein